MQTFAWLDKLTVSLHSVLRTAANRSDSKVTFPTERRNNSHRTHLLVMVRQQALKELGSGFVDFNSQALAGSSYEQ